MALSRFQAADDSPGFLLWQLTNLWQQRIRAALLPLGITHVQFVLLASVAWLENSTAGVTQAALARHAHTDVMMTSQVIRVLEEKGLVRRAAHPTDTRAKVISLTPEGKKTAQRAMILVEEADDRFFQSLGEDIPAFVTLMQQLVAAHAAT